MGKRDLKKYLNGLEKDQLEDQLILLYDKFPDVKKYYDFVFNPREDKLLSEAKAKISNEYFPIKSRRARLRRSVAQKCLKEFITLGVDHHLVADLMFYNIEIAQKYSASRNIRFDSFYTSILKSFQQAVAYTVAAGITEDFIERMEKISNAAQRQKWLNCAAFSDALEDLHN